MSSKGFEFSFGWLFAIIVGAAIIALAIYATTSFIESERSLEDSSKGLELSGLLRQLETGLEESGMHVITTNAQTRISNGCALTGNTVSERIFGVQSIKTSISSNIGGDKWSDDGIPLRSPSIYLFSNKTIEGKSFVTLSQSFEYPYKIGDLVLIWPSSERYCFVNSPLTVESDLTNLQVPGINFSTSTSRCPQGSKKICFAQTGCDIDVSDTTKSVTKNRNTVYFDSVGSALFYAAIFSEKEIYDCQIVRLTKKGSMLAEIYAEKARFGMAYGCSADSVVSILNSFGQQLNSTRSSADLSSYSLTREDLKRNNEALACPVF